MSGSGPAVGRWSFKTCQGRDNLVKVHPAANWTQCNVWKLRYTEEIWVNDSASKHSFRSQSQYETSRSALAPKAPRSTISTPCKSYMPSTPSTFEGKDCWPLGADRTTSCNISFLSAEGWQTNPPHSFTCPPNSRVAIFPQTTLQQPDNELLFATCTVWH